jgi:hypothetical protein
MGLYRRAGAARELTLLDALTHFSSPERAARVGGVEPLLRNDQDPSLPMASRVAAVSGASSPRLLR